MMLPLATSPRNRPSCSPSHHHFHSAARSLVAACFASCTLRQYRCMHTCKYWYSMTHYQHAVEVSEQQDTHSLCLQSKTILESRQMLFKQLLAGQIQNELPDAVVSFINSVCLCQLQGLPLHGADALRAFEEVRQPSFCTPDCMRKSSRDPHDEHCSDTSRWCVASTRPSAHSSPNLACSSSPCVLEIVCSGT